MGMFGFDIPDPTNGFLSELPLGSAIFESPTEKANADAIASKRKAAEYYRQYAPEAMRVRQEAMRAAAGAFSPLQQYIQRMTGAAPFDIQGAFKPAQDFMDRQAQQAQQAQQEQANRGVAQGFFGANSPPGGR